MNFNKSQIDAIQAFIKMRVDLALEEVQAKADMNAEATEQSIRFLVKRRVDEAAEAWNYRLEVARLMGVWLGRNSLAPFPRPGEEQETLREYAQLAREVLAAAGIDEPEEVAEK